MDATNYFLSAAELAALPAGTVLDMADHPGYLTVSWVGPDGHGNYLVTEESGKERAYIEKFFTDTLWNVTSPETLAKAGVITFLSETGATSAEDIAEYVTYARSQGQADIVSYAEVSRVTGWGRAYVRSMADLVLNPNPNEEEQYDPYGD